MTATATKIPALRFPEFEGEWVENTLENLFSFKNGLNKEKEYFGRGTPIVNFKDVFNESDLNKANIKGLVEVTDKEKANYSANKGDVFFTRTSETIEEIGIAAVLSEGIEDCVFSGFVLRARPKNHTLVDLFKKYCFSISSVRKEIVTKSSFTTRALTSGTLLNKVVIIYPSSNAEQQKIATFITTIDTRIQQLSRKKALLEQYKKGVMQQIFSQEIRFKDEEGREFPAWEQLELCEVAVRVLEKNRDNAITFVLTNSATQGIVSQQDYFDKDIANPNNLEGYYVVQIDDFVYNPRISSTAPVGPVKRNKLSKGVMSPLYTVFRFKIHDIQFFEYFFETTQWHFYMKSVANYGIRHDRMNITNADFIKMPIPIPVLEEQQKIAAFLSTLDRQINLVSQQLERMQAFKKGLLQQMFV